MAKTKEELNTLKTEYETLNNKLKELTEDELKMVIGGEGPNYNLAPNVPDSRRDSRNNFATNKYRCLDCGHEYTAHVVGDVRDGHPDPKNNYLGDDFGCCPKCGSIHIQSLGIL